MFNTTTWKMPWIHVPPERAQEDARDALDTLRVAIVPTAVERPDLACVVAAVALLVVAIPNLKGGDEKP